MTNVGVLQSNLKAVCQRLIAKAVASGLEAFGSQELPRRESESMWLEPNAQGGHSGESRTVQRIDLGALWMRALDELEDCDEWSAAEGAMEAYEKACGASVNSLWITYNGYCYQLLDEYFARANRFEVLPSVVDAIVGELVVYCRSSIEGARILLALEGFSAAGAFGVDPGILIRPITQAELEEYGERPPLFPFQTVAGHTWPRDDWWVCDVKTQGAKGLPEAQNKSQETCELFKSGLSVFMAGRFTAIPLGGSKDGSCGVEGRHRGGNIARHSSQKDPYHLSEQDIESLQQFWPRFQAIMMPDFHYLQLPARRLELGAERTRRGDALVDYVIGLEALLSKGGEQTEIRYRFSVRGAVVLSPAPADRRGKFEEMHAVYDMRSRIVHGGQPESQQLAQVTLWAGDALRTRWHWYSTDGQTRQPTIRR